MNTVKMLISKISNAVNAHVLVIFFTDIDEHHISYLEFHLQVLLYHAHFYKVRFVLVQKFCT